MYHSEHPAYCQSQCVSYVPVEHRSNHKQHHCIIRKYLYSNCNQYFYRLHGNIKLCHQPKYHATQHSDKSAYCNNHVRITISASYRIRRGNLFVEHRCNYHFHFGEQCKYLYRDSHRS
jgi:hypothetical protein